MTTDTSSSNNDKPAVGRRATDQMPLKFKGPKAPAAGAQEIPLAEEEFETINLDAVLPPGGEADFRAGEAAAEPAQIQLSADQRKHRLQLAAYKKTFLDFPVRDGLSRVDMADLKRGDVLRVNTIVGGLYLTIVDRIKVNQSSAGVILCECHYDLGDQCTLVHTASIELPVCSNAYVITNTDGSTRNASRGLKISTEIELPAHVRKLLHERFFLDMGIYINPQPEKYRPVDFARLVAKVFLGVWRVIVRVMCKIKSIIDENNRVEREKKARKTEALRLKKDAQQKEKEAKQAARAAAKKRD